jgi:ACR3 family arsenite efflux pump ArsB
VAGLILLAAAPCTAMVFVWSRLTNGGPLFTSVVLYIVNMSRFRS